MSQLIGADFDEEGRLEPSDDERIRRFAELAAAAARGSNLAVPVTTALRRLPRSVVYAAAAAALLCTGAAAAQLWSGFRASPLASEQVPAVRSKVPAMTERLPPRVSHAVPTPVVSDSALLQRQGPASDGSTAAAAAAPPEVQHSPAVESAASLFAKANDARRSGDAAAATALYRQLQAAFPGSAESRLSRVSLGRLLFDNGSPAAALSQFDSYSSLAGGELRLEALYGRAKALGALGRAGDEERAWQRLLKEFPSSVYTERAQKRLGELR